MNNDLISRSAAIEQIERREKLMTGDKRVGVEHFKIFLMNRPAIDAEPVRHGRWIDHGDYITTAYGSLDLKICSICNAEVTLDGYDYYCANCGAKMDAEVSE